ncbi:hypothetical protein [Shewanella sp. NFH-SH190041]|uniref:hypothetical protein n=1 Tax=Shewanella sp. NFH-SH190041 TaxID=2950245 RepID=UPI0021C3488B|nr:hypothetical protein [Shewanella sp. NFH-SH190041]
MNAAEARELAAAFDAVPRPNQICSDARHKSVQHQAVVLLEEYNQIMTLPADERLVALVSFQAKAKAWKNFKAKTHPAAEAAGQADVIPLFCQ